MASNLPLLLIGFSLIIGPVLVAAYLRSDLYPRSRYSIAAMVCLTTLLMVLQAHHAAYFLTDVPPVDAGSYVVSLLLAPALFFYAGRFVIWPDAAFSVHLIWCLTPCLLPLLMPLQVTIAVVLLIGAGYATWFSWIVYTIRSQRRQYRFEMLFALVVTSMAAGVFLLGAFFPRHSEGWFYLFYSQSIGIAYVMVTFALIAIPDFVTDLFDLTRGKYAASTLDAVDVKATLSHLHRVMEERELYREEGLSLTSLAQEIGLTPHQLSELLNHHLGTGFSQYLRRHRVDAARRQLVANPADTILAIGMDVGFRSQSTFYAAFKAESGLSPGEFRQRALLQDKSGTP